MRRRFRRISPVGDESGMTLIEMLVASMMSVIIVGASCAMLISAVRDQPALSRKAQNVTTARYQLERMVREIRNGVQVESASSSTVTFVARVRRVACGGAVQTNPGAEAVQCKITYSCIESTCTRTEKTMAGIAVGVSTVAASGIGSTEVFCFAPSSGIDPSQCGPADDPEAATYIGVSLEVPNPEGPGLLTISDGATLRSAAFGASSSSSS
jgi:Tfp pilus assembly protein PilV